MPIKIISAKALFLRHAAAYFLDSGSDRVFDVGEGGCCEFWTLAFESSLGASGLLVLALLRQEGMECCCGDDQAENSVSGGAIGVPL
jgi:hypothetical protein